MPDPATVPLPLFVLTLALLVCAVGVIAYLLWRLRSLSKRSSEEDIRQMVHMGEEKGAIEKE